MNVGDKLTAIVPVQVSEDCCWEPGTTVQVIERTDHDPSEYGSYAVELQSDDGQIGSFAEIDVHGEFAWFRPAIATLEGMV